MTVKRKPTLKHVFNAWLKYKKKQAETFTAKFFLENLAREIKTYATELIEHEGKIYRVTTEARGYGCTYSVEEIAKTTELPIKN